MKDNAEKILKRANAVELKPGKAYILVFKRGAGIDVDDLETLTRFLQQAKVSGVMVMLDNIDDLKVVEAPVDENA